MESIESSTSPTDEPVLAYTGTSGNVDVDSSREETYRVDTTGITAMAQKLALILAGQAKAKGITIAELREDKNSLHHGRMSSALTNLHIGGRLVALREKRDRCTVYVLPEFVNGREVRPYRRQARALNPEVIVGVLLAHVRVGEPWMKTQRCMCDQWEWTAGDSHYDHLAREIVAALEVPHVGAKKGGRLEENRPPEGNGSSLPLSEQITAALGSDDWLIVWNGHHLVDADELDQRSADQDQQVHTQEEA